MKHLTHSEPSGGRHRPHRACQDAPPADRSQRTFRTTLLGLVASVVVGFGVLFTAEGALGAEPAPDSATAEVSLASLGAVTPGNPSDAVSPTASGCSSHECGPSIDAPDTKPLPTVSTPPNGSAAYSTRLNRSIPHIERVETVGDRQVGVRIVQPFYATVAMPRRPSWSPLAGRPVGQRILVGVRFVVPF